MIHLDSECTFHLYHLRKQFPIISYFRRDPFIVLVLSLSFIGSIFFLHISAKVIRAFTKWSHCGLVYLMIRDVGRPPFETRQATRSEGINLNLGWFKLWCEGLHNGPWYLDPLFCPSFVTKNHPSLGQYFKLFYIMPFSDGFFFLSAARQKNKRKSFEGDNSQQREYRNIGNSILYSVLVRFALH